MQSKPSEFVISSLILGSLLILTGCGGSGNTGGGAQAPSTPNKEIQDTLGSAEKAGQLASGTQSKIGSISTGLTASGSENAASSTTVQGAGATDRPGDTAAGTTPKAPADPNRASQLEGITKVFDSVFQQMKSGLEAGKNPANVTNMEAFKAACFKLEEAFRKFDGLRAQLEKPDLGKEEFDRLSKEFSSAGNEVLELLEIAKKLLKTGPEAPPATPVDSPAPSPTPTPAAFVVSAARVQKLETDLAAARMPWNSAKQAFEDLYSRAQKMVENHQGDYNAIRQHSAELKGIHDSRVTKVEAIMKNCQNLIAQLKKPGVTEKDASSIEARIASEISGLAGETKEEGITTGTMAGYLK